MSQLIVLIIFGAIALIRYLVRQSASPPSRPGGGTRPVNLPPAPPRPRQSSQPGDDERLRKFMEALGVPNQTQPPPRIARPQPPYTPHVQPLARKQPPKPPPTPLVVREFSKPPVLSAPTAQAYQTETVGAQAPVATGYDVAMSATPAASGVASAGVVATSTSTDLKSLLKSPSSIRTAILLKEILGAPRGLQPMGDLPALR